MIRKVSENNKIYTQRFQIIDDHLKNSTKHESLHHKCIVDYIKFTICSKNDCYNGNEFSPEMS